MDLNHELFVLLNPFKDTFSVQETLQIISPAKLHSISVWLGNHMAPLPRSQSVLSWRLETKLLQSAAPLVHACNDVDKWILMLIHPSRLQPNEPPGGGQKRQRKSIKIHSVCPTLACSELFRKPLIEGYVLVLRCRSGGLRDGKMED